MNKCGDRSLHTHDTTIWWPVFLWSLKRDIPRPFQRLLLKYSLRPCPDATYQEE